MSDFRFEEPDQPDESNGHKEEGGIPDLTGNAPDPNGEQQEFYTPGERSLGDPIGQAGEDWTAAGSIDREAAGAEEPLDKDTEELLREIAGHLISLESPGATDRSGPSDAVLAEDGHGRAEDLRAIRLTVINDAQQLLGGQHGQAAAEQLDPAGTAAALAGIITLHGITDQPPVADAVDDIWAAFFAETTQQVDAAEASAARQVRELRERLEGLEEAADDRYLAQAYFVEGARFGDEESLQKMHGILTDERESAGVLRAEDSEAVIDAAEDYALLEAVVETSEELGLPPEDLIDRYAGRKDKETAWRLKLDHYRRLNEGGVDVQQAAAASSAALLTPSGVDGAFSEQFIGESTAQALAVCQDPLLRGRLVNRAIEANERLLGRYLDGERQPHATPESLNSLLDVAEAALAEADPYIIERLDEVIGDTDRELRRQLASGIQGGEIPVALDDKLARWDVATKVRSGWSPEDIAQVIVNQAVSSDPFRYGEKLDTLLNTAAAQFIATGRHEAANYLIGHMTPDQQDWAYVQYWGLARTPEQLAQLDPEDMDGVYIVHPGLQECYQAAQVLVSGDVAAMTGQALATVRELRRAATESAASPLTALNAKLRWQQVEQLLNKVGDTGGTPAAAALSRAILLEVREADMPFLSNSYLQPVYEWLMSNYQQADYELARDTMLARHDGNAAWKAIDLIGLVLRFW